MTDRLNTAHRKDEWMKKANQDQFEEKPVMTLGLLKEARLFHKLKTKTKQKYSSLIRYNICFFSFFFSTF